MMRKSQWFMVAVVVVLLGACYGEDNQEAPGEELSASKGEGHDPAATPVAVVKAFFKAMETDDRKAMARLMTPKRAKRMEKPGAWDTWLAVWKKVTVVRVGEVLTEKGADGNLPERVKVQVEYRHGERTIKDSVNVSRIDGRWYWDEN